MLLHGHVTDGNVTALEGSNEMTTINYTLLGDTVDIRVYDAPFGHGDEFRARGYEWTGRWEKLITGREEGSAEARWLKATFPNAKLERDVSGGGVA